MNKRIEYFDIAKGICITLVVLEHCWHVFPELPKMDIITISDAFRMPLYFFLSGIFFKPYEGFIGFIKRKTNKLLIPFFSFYFIFTILLKGIVLSVSGVPFDVDVMWSFATENMPYNSVIWFLLCLFFTNCIFYICYVTVSCLPKKYQTIILVVICTILGLIGFLLDKNHINIGLFLDTAMTALPFFCTGYILFRKTNLLRTIFIKWIYLIVATLMFVLLYLYPIHPYYAGNNYGCGILELYVLGLCGITAIISLSIFVKHIPGISYFGRYSIILLLTHQIVMGPIVHFFELFIVNHTAVMYLTFIVLMGSYFVLIPLSIKYIPHITAQKDLIPIKVENE